MFRATKIHVISVANKIKIKKKKNVLTTSFIIPENIVLKM